MTLTLKPAPRFDGKPPTHAVRAALVQIAKTLPRVVVQAQGDRPAWYDVGISVRGGTDATYVTFWKPRTLTPETPAVETVMAAVAEALQKAGWRVTDYGSAGLLVAGPGVEEYQAEVKAHQQQVLAAQKAKEAEGEALLALLAKYGVTRGYADSVGKVALSLTEVQTLIAAARGEAS